MTIAAALASGPGQAGAGFFASIPAAGMAMGRRCRTTADAPHTRR